jgi:predicted DCC family thiol-disulfide oxidoreductase YuxK
MTDSSVANSQGPGGSSSARRHLILYDGVCGLCNRLVQFILPRDRLDAFVFAALQSDLAAQVLARHGRDASEGDTFFVVRDYGTPRERLLDRSDAGLFVAKTLGRGWQLVWPLRFVPRPLRDLGYGLIARNRYRVFGRLEQCMLPSPGARHKFLNA